MLKKYIGWEDRHTKLEISRYIFHECGYDTISRLCGGDIESIRIISTNKKSNIRNECRRSEKFSRPNYLTAYFKMFKYKLRYHILKSKCKY